MTSVRENNRSQEISEGSQWLLRISDWHRNSVVASERRRTLVPIRADPEELHTLLTE